MAMFTGNKGTIFYETDNGSREKVAARVVRFSGFRATAASLSEQEIVLQKQAEKHPIYMVLVRDSFRACSERIPSTNEINFVHVPYI